MKTTRSGRARRARFARKSFGWAFSVGIVVLGLIALLDPADFGRPSTNTLRTGWPAAAVGALVVAGLALFALTHKRMRASFDTVREPFRRPLDGSEAYEGASAALEDCPQSLQTRFAFGWVWGPGALAVAGTTFAWAAAFFILDALLSRLTVGWQQGAFFGADIVLSLLCFALGAGRLRTWKLAVSVYRNATIGYR